MTAEPTKELDQARRRIDAFVDSWVNDPERDEKIAAAWERAETSPRLSPADVAEALGLS